MADLIGVKVTNTSYEFVSTTYLNIPVNSPGWKHTYEVPPVAGPSEVADGDGNQYYVDGDGITRWNVQQEAYEHHVVHGAAGSEVAIQYGSF
jgi:hypothetical protein